MDQQQIRELLARAEEIQTHNAVELESRPEVRQLVDAAEESGLDREAVLQALRERISLTERPLDVGDLVFAASSDNHFYAATVTETKGAHVRVSFLNGGEATLDRENVKPLNVMPGLQLYCPWPGWGWWKSAVVSYDSANRKVTVSDGMMSQMSFHLSDVRLNATRPPILPDQARQWLVIGAVALSSGVLGALLMRLLTR